jgi:phosphate transport system substrate-binding protein
MRMLYTVLLCGLVFPACSKKTSGSDMSVRLSGAGATFPYPLYSKWMAEYHRATPQVTINYQSIGSGGGIRQITERTVDFGASDAPMSDAQLAKAPGLLHLPTTLGAVVLAYQVPGLPTGLRLTPELISGIFLGTITQWNDPGIAALNPSMKLPDQKISVIHRTDGSGTTAVFTEYLSKVNPAWKEKVGTGTSVRWPIGLGAKGNEGVAGMLKTTPGALGYVELAYAIQTQIPYALVRNRAGEFVGPKLENITAAAAGLGAAIAPDLRLSITDAPGGTAYPISSFSFLLVPQELSDGVKGKALVQFLWWAIHDGQKFAPSLHYAPLPAEIVTRVEQKLKLITSAGKPILAS